jgi:hypothetical protein
MEPIKDTDVLFEKKPEAGKLLPSPDIWRLVDMVLEFCEQCEVRGGATPGNACEAMQCRFVPLYRETGRVLGK